MNYEELDILYRSRKVALEILKEDGYDTSQYEQFGPWEIEAMVAGGPTALTMDLKKTPAAMEQNPNGMQRCLVMYSLQKLKQRLATFLGILRNDVQPPIETATTEVFVILLEDVADVFHAAALNEWLRDKLRIRFFKAHNLLFDPRTHELVPPHTKLPASEHAALMADNYLKKSQLPFIKFHEDMIGRIMGLVPGDIVKITRPSPSSGTYETYRVCMP
jgi:DNA-directed RNA polymerase subunit H (RpoH/RPB5)